MGSLLRDDVGIIWGPHLRAIRLDIRNFEKLPKLW